MHWISRRSIGRELRKHPRERFHRKPFSTPYGLGGVHRAAHGSPVLHQTRSASRSLPRPSPRATPFPVRESLAAGALLPHAGCPVARLAPLLNSHFLRDGYECLHGLFKQRRGSIALDLP